MVRTQREPLVQPNSNSQLPSTTLQTNHPLYGITNSMDIKKWKIKRLSMILGLIFVIGIVAWLYVDHTLPEFNQYRLVKRYNQKTPLENANPIRFILLWNKFVGDHYWSLPDDVNDPGYFRKNLNCVVADCVVTNVRDVMPQLDMYDAILFHTSEPFSVINAIPKRRSWKQLYIFVLRTPPVATKHVLSDESEFYNLTMTYRRDSDILLSHYYFADKITGGRLIPSEDNVWRTTPNRYNDTSVWNLMPYKVKLAAWIVSECKTFSRREKLVNEIQKYMEVDVFGKCGTKSCEIGSPECNKLLDEHYKFYFSFESSLCTDYITENLYNIMRLNIIPIVYGGANYKYFLPPHSYINVEDYKTPRDLVKYLKYLSDSPEEYMRYFWWRQYYDLEFHSPFCDLCKRLHQPNYILKSQTYRNIEKWWLDGSCRSDSNIKF